jgi:hypothetical protein
MARRIKKSESFVSEREVQLSELPGLAVDLFFWDDIRYACLLPGLHLV